MYNLEKQLLYPGPKVEMGEIADMQIEGEAEGRMSPDGEFIGDPDEIELTDCQRYWQENYESCSQETMRDTIIGLLGEIKRWELELDKAIAQEPGEFEDRATILEDAMEEISHEMMSVNM